MPFFFLSVAVIIFSSFAYYLEKEAAASYVGPLVDVRRLRARSLLHCISRVHARSQDDDAAPHAFRSIPHAIWFMMVTMTTVGYGDVVPFTDTGRAISIIAMVFGVLFLSMPLAIVGNNFCQIWDDRKRVIFIDRFIEVRARDVL